MNRILTILYAVVLLAATTARAASVDVSTPGTLCQSGVSDSDNSLTVSGQINAADLFWIAERLPQLTELNLASATIQAYSGPMLHGAHNYPAATLPTAVFAGARLTSVTLPVQNNLVISDCAFCASALTSVTLPPTARLGQYVFAGCTALSSVTLQAEGFTVSDGTFDGCSALSTVNGLDSASAIGANAFRGTTALHNISLGKGLTDIGSYAFAGSGLTAVNMDVCSHLRSVGAWAFSGCPNLTAVSFNTAANIALGHGVLANCPALESVQLPKSASVPAYALMGSTQVTDLSGVAALTDSIGAYALKGNRATEMTLSPSLRHIGTGAMEEMPQLRSIDASLVAEAPTLDADVWRGVATNNVTLNVLASNKDSFVSAPQWRNFHINVATGVDNVTPDAASSLRARFHGTLLQLQSPGTVMDRVQVYDTAGRLLADTAPRTDRAQIETSNFATRLFVVLVTTGGNNITTIKLKR